MQKAVIRNTTSLKVREGASTEFRQIGSLYNGDSAFGQLDTVTNWFHVWYIVKGNGNTITINGWASAAYLTITEAPVVDPPPPPPTNELPATWDVTQIAKDANGNTLATYTGTLTKQ